MISVLSASGAVLATVRKEFTNTTDFIRGEVCPCCLCVGGRIGGTISLRRGRCACRFAHVYICRIGFGCSLNCGLSNRLQFILRVE